MGAHLAYRRISVVKTLTADPYDTILPLSGIDPNEDKNPPGRRRAAESRVNLHRSERVDHVGFKNKSCRATYIDVGDAQEVGFGKLQSATEPLSKS